jgi:hypothetical protein
MVVFWDRLLNPGKTMLAGRFQMFGGVNDANCFANFATVEIE